MLRQPVRFWPCDFGLKPERRCAWSGLLAPISVLYVFWSDSSPTDVVLSQFDKPVKRRPRPIDNAMNQFMLARIPMYVINTSFQIVLVPNHVLPKTRLPNPALSTLALGIGNVCFWQSSRKPLVAELCLDLLNAE